MHAEAHGTSTTTIYVLIFVHPLRSMANTTLHASTCDHSKHRILCIRPKASKKQPIRYTCVDVYLVNINGISRVSSPWRDDTSTQNRQGTVNESMLL